jgi:hypothetical protein
MGSTNYGKLTNVSLQFQASADAVSAAAVSGASFSSPSSLASSGAPITQTYESIIMGLNHNIVRVSGGALGFPIL